jgi:hypothetical protein
MDQEVDTPIEDDELEVVQEDLDGTSQTEEDPPEGADDEVEASGETPGDDGEFAVSIGDDEPDPESIPKEAPEWVRGLRKDYQKLAREARELRAENERLKAEKAPPAIVVGDKPTMESCDFDEATYEAAYEDWRKRKSDAEAQVRQRETAQAEEQKAWDARVAAYQEAKLKVKAKVPDFDDAEAAVLASFDVTQQGILLLAKQPELLTLALGKNDKVREGLAKVKNYGEFAIAVGELMTKLKVTSKKPVPPPERRLSGSAPGSRGTGGPDKTLERLRAEADKTGDRSKVIAHMAKQRQAA